MKKFMTIFLSIVIFVSPWVFVNGLPFTPDLSPIENIVGLALILFYAFLKWLACVTIFMLLYLFSFAIAKVILRILDFDRLDAFDFLFDKEKEVTVTNTACFLGMVLPPFAWWCYNVYQIYKLFN